MVAEVVPPEQHLEPPGRILVVEDQEALRFALRDLLTDEGFVVQLAADGVQAVEVATRFEPEVTLMDLRMPGWDGLEATQQIKGQDPVSQVVLFTASDDLATRKWARDQGVFCCLRKGVSPDLIIDTVTQALVYKRKLESAPDE
jgi:CheY-like chemotaxis protein